MKIHAITNTYPPKTGNTIQRKESDRKIILPSYTSLAYSYSNLSFGQNLCYADFLNSVTRVYKTKSLKNVILSTINNKENYIGSGFSADAYDIPEVKDYILRIERKTFSPQSFVQNPIIEEPQNALAPNFGQYIASNNHGFFINKKVFGTSHSLPDWVEKIIKIENGEELLHKDAKIILAKIENIAKYPLSSFDSLARNIKKLNKFTQSEIDIINPNNLIVNDEKKEFGIIDLWYKHKDSGSRLEYNGIDSMINLMLDPFTHKCAYDKLNNADKKLFKESSRKIILKALEAGENQGLERTMVNATAIYRDFDRKLPKPFAEPSYNDFLEMYQDLL